MHRFILTSICLVSVALLLGCEQAGRGDQHVDSAMVLYEQRQFAEAIPEFKRALDEPLVANSRSDILSVIGNCYNELDQFDESLKYHDLAIEEDPQNYKAYVNKGIVYRLLGEFDQAAAMYQKALDLNPNYAELHGSMGALAIHQNQTPKAIKHLELAVQLDDSLAIAHSNLAYAYATAGRFDEAELELQQAIERGYHQPQVIREKIEELRAAADEK